MKIYVASSWRNKHQPIVVKRLRADGYDVYNFKEEGGFHWSEVDPSWKQWRDDVPRYLSGLKHPCAERGFKLDMNALRACDVCLYVMPCGVSASFEAGWARGAGKKVFVYVPALEKPDLMVKMADLITDDFELICIALALAEGQLRYR